MDERRPSTALRSLRATPGQKAVAAVSGGILASYVGAHMLGLLGAFAGREALNAYGASLQGMKPLLWTLRGVLALALALHVSATLSLARRARRARGPHALPPRTRLTTMTLRIGGPLLLVFIVLHVLHMTTGTLHAAFVPGDVYGNLVTGLRSPLVAAGYLFAVLLVGLHLRHGLSSAPRSLGAFAASARAPRRPLARAVAAVIVAGFVVLPVAVLSGVLR